MKFTKMILRVGGTKRMKHKKLWLPKTKAMPDKFYEVKEGIYSTLTPEQYAEYEKKLEEFMTAPRPRDEKAINASVCQDYFPNIQAQNPKFADYELVESLDVRGIYDWGCWLHINFKAKHKDAPLSSAALYFAEIDCTKQRGLVTCLTQLNPDPSTVADTSSYMHCGYCHPGPEIKKRVELCVSGSGCVYHPVGGGFCAGVC